MILEIAILEAKQGKRARLEELGREIAAYRSHSENQPKGWRSFRFLQAIEDSDRFVLHLTWDSVEDHHNSGQSEFGQRVSEAMQDCVEKATVHHYDVLDGCAINAIEI